MKKILLAAALVTSGSTSAATLYEENGLSYRLNGDWQIQLRKSVTKVQNRDVEFDDLELQNSISYALGGDLKAFGQLDFDFKDAAEGDSKSSGSTLEEAYLGLDFGAVRIALGKMNFASDEFGIERAYELDQKEDRFDAQGTNGDDVIRLDSTLGNVIFSASTELAGKENQQDRFLDLYLAADIKGLELAAAYQSKKESAVAAVNTWGVSLSYAKGHTLIAGDYSRTQGVAEQYNLVVGMDITKQTSMRVGVVRVDKESGSRVIEGYTNISYRFAAQKRVKLFAEVAHSDKKNADWGYLAGIRIQF